MRKFKKVSYHYCSDDGCGGGCGSEKAPETPVNSTEETKTEAVSESHVASKAGDRSRYSVRY